jgi:hypothetical protein
VDIPKSGKIKDSQHEKRKFHLYWKSGKHEVYEGETITEVFCNRFNPAMLDALDFWEEFLIKEKDNT